MSGIAAISRYSMMVTVTVVRLPSVGGGMEPFAFRGLVKLTLKFRLVVPSRVTVYEIVFEA